MTDTLLDAMAFSKKHKLKMATLREYAKRGMPHRKGKGEVFFYPEREALEWIAANRPQFPPRHRPDAHYVTSSWITKLLGLSTGTITAWVRKYSCPARHTNGDNSALDIVYFEPLEFLNWFRQHEQNNRNQGGKERRREQLELLETAIAEHMSIHPEPAAQTAAETNTETISETITDMIPEVKKVTDVLKAQLKDYDLCRRFAEGDEVQVVPCNGRSNGIPNEQMYTSGKVLRNEDSVGMVLCELNAMPCHIPASNLRLLRAVEDIPKYGIIERDCAFFITHKGVREACAWFAYGTPTLRTREDAQTMAELALELIAEKEVRNG